MAYERIAMWAAWLGLAVLGCGARGGTYDRVLALASRDLSCPAYATSGTGATATTTRMITVAQEMGPHWRASCRGRTARYRCDVGSCRRDEAQGFAPSSPWLDAGSLECRTVGWVSDGGDGAARALAGVSSEARACEVEGFSVIVAPLTGAVTVDFVTGEAALSARRCIADAVGRATVSPPPPDQQRLACRVGPAP